MMSTDPKPTGIVGAAMALDDLREAMKTIRYRSPLYRPGTGPTAEDACHHVLDMIEHGIKLVSTYLEVPEG